MTGEIVLAQTASIQKYLDAGLAILDKFGLKQEQPEESQLVKLLEDVKSVDEAKVMAIARVVHYQGAFCQLVDQNLQAEDICTDYQTIQDMFESIRQDSKRLIEQLEDGKIDMWEKLENFIVRIRRGSIQDRVKEIKDVYRDVSDGTRGRLEKEENILEAYSQYRLAVKSVEPLAYEVLERQTKILEDAKENFRKAADAVTEFQGIKSDLTRLELTRADMEKTYKDEDRRYQLVKDVAELITLGYNTGDALAIKLAQTHQSEQRLYSKSVAFYSTQESVLSLLSATYVAKFGEYAQAETINRMNEGINEALKDQAVFSKAGQEKILQAGYGSTVKAETLKIFVDALVEHEETSRPIIERLRAESAQNSIESSRILNEGKQRIANALSNYEQGRAA